MMPLFSLHLGDCLATLRGMAENSVDSIVTDPPYGLAFMGKRWDYDVPSTEIWAECLRVLKPGGHLLAFAGTRTQHRMAVRIEDAGFEIRDMIAWVYSSGFPKSMNLDRLKGEKICGCEGSSWAKAECDLRQVRCEHVSPTEPAEKERGQVLQPYMPKQGSPVEGWQQLPATEVRYGQSCLEGRCDAPEASRELRVGALHQGAAVGSPDDPQGRVCDGAPLGHGHVDRKDAAPARSGASRGSQPAEQRQAEPGAVAGQSEPQALGAWPVCGGCGLPRVPAGLGTAIKPAMEPITVARKPLAGTVAANVLKNGAGALNIDGCRVGELANGRWPANLIHDGSDEVLALFPDAPGQQCASSDNQRTRANCYGALSHGDKQYTPRADSGSAARFFYCAKTSRKDRNEGLQDPGPQLKHGATLRQVENSATTGNTHPTVKPSDLMAYLCRLVTPPGGVVLDPFMGSGSTGKAAMREGFQFIGCELDPAYFEIARARIENELPTWSIGMPIYMTHFDPVTKLPTSGSIDSGFGSIDEAVAVLGDNYLSRGVRSVTYPGVMLTDYVLTASSRQVKLPADS